MAVLGARENQNESRADEALLSCQEEPGCSNVLVRYKLL
jgi:hypothetical protein